jgi:hypothetical protein
MMIKIQQKYSVQITVGVSKLFVYCLSTTIKLILIVYRQKLVDNWLKNFISKSVRFDSVHRYKILFCWLTELTDK